MTVTIFPSSTFDEDAVVFWQPKGSKTSYRIIVQKIFPMSSFKKVWENAMNAEPTTFTFYKYIKAKLMRYRQGLEEGDQPRVGQFKDDEKLLWLEGSS